MPRQTRTQRQALRILKHFNTLMSINGHIFESLTLDFSSSSKMALGALGGGGGRSLSAGRTGSCFTIPGREQGHAYFK